MESAMKSKVAEIQSFLKGNGISVDYVTVEYGELNVFIEWGDWKHDHMRCDLLMKNKGYESTGMDVTNEDETDCYSAIHYYKLK